MCLCSSRPPPSLSAWKLCSATSGSFSILCVTLLTAVTTQEERARGLSFPVTNRKAPSVVAGGELKFVPWKQEAGLGIMSCFAAPLLFFFCPSYLLVLFTPCNKWACCKGPFPTTHSSRSVALEWYFIKKLTCLGSWQPGVRCTPSCITSLLRCGWVVVMGKPWIILLDHSSL